MRKLPVEPRLPNGSWQRVNELFRETALAVNGLIDRPAPASGTTSIPELATDPLSPTDGQAWIERRTDQPIGTLRAIAGGFPITAQTPVYSYFFSVKTTTGGIKKVKME